MADAADLGAETGGTFSFNRGLLGSDFPADLAKGLAVLDGDVAKSCAAAGDVVADLVLLVVLGAGWSVPGGAAEGAIAASTDSTNS